jgi:hypothetical protein
MRSSAGLSVTSSASSGSGITATVQALVWMRPWVSVAGTRCTRWPPTRTQLAVGAVAFDAQHQFLVAAQFGSALSLMISVRQPWRSRSAGTCAPGRRRTAPIRRRRCRRGSRGRRCARRRGRFGSSAAAARRPGAQVGLGGGDLSCAISAIVGSASISARSARSARAAVAPAQRSTTASPRPARATARASADVGSTAGSARLASSSASRKARRSKRGAEGRFHRRCRGPRGDGAPQWAARRAGGVAGGRRLCRAGTGATRSAASCSRSGRRRRAARPACRAASSASGRGPGLPAPRPHLALGQQLARAGHLGRAPVVGLGVQAWISGTAARWSSQCMKLCTPASMMASACARRPGASRRPVCTTPTGRRRCRGRRRPAPTSGSMSRGTARSTMNIGRAAARLQRALDRAQADDGQRAGGAGLTTASNSCSRWAGRPGAWPRAEAAGQLLAALQRAVGDRHGLGGCARRSAWPPARSSRRRRRTARGSRAGPRTAAPASRTAAAAMLIECAPISVEVRTSLATEKLRWNSWCSVVPSVPASSACAHGLLHLAQDLGLAQHHRIQPAGHAEGVARRGCRWR